MPRTTDRPEPIVSDTAERPGTQSLLDESLAMTFPASDPLSISQPGHDEPGLGDRAPGGGTGRSRPGRRPGRRVARPRATRHRDR